MSRPFTRSTSRIRRAATLIELTLVLSIAAVVVGIVVPRISDTVDKISVRSAVRDLKTAFVTGRMAAVGRGRMISVHIHPRDTSMVVQETLSGDTLLLRYLGRVHGVSLRSNRDSMVFAITGLGYSAANSSIYIARRAVAETVRVSREGRAR